MTACQLGKESATSSLPVLVNHNTSFEITIPPGSGDVPNVPACQFGLNRGAEKTYILILGMVPSGGVMKLALLNPDPSCHKFCAL